MASCDIVTFGIPLMARSVAQDWQRIEHQLSATVGSIYNQTDPNFRIIVACTDRPNLKIKTDERLEFLTCEQRPAVDHTAFNTDAVHKRIRIAQRLKQLDGGYLMFADADDLVSRDLVAYVRKTAHPNGYSIGRGYMFDAVRGWLAPFPFSLDARFDLESHTCAVFNISADELPEHDEDYSTRFVHLMREGHPAFRKRAEAEGRPLLDIPFRAAVYVRNTGENISTRAAATSVDGRTTFQAYLDDQLEAQRIERTPELDAEFNLKDAEAPPATSRPMRLFRPLIGLSVLVATHRRPAGLRRLLTALRPQVEGRPERSIIVINDGSHDDAYAEIVAEFADVIEYREMPKAVGLGAVRNAALDLCRGAYAVFTDDDCEPPPWWLDWLLARLVAHPEIDVVIGTTMPLWTNKDFRERLQGEWFLPQPSRLGRWDVFVTANVAIRAELLRNVGGFISSLDVGEDTELCVRLHRARARFASDYRWQVRHEVGKPTLALARRYRAYGEAQARIGAAAALEIPRAIRGGFGERAAAFLRLRREYARRAQSAFGPNPLVQARAAICAAMVQYAYFRGLAELPR